jgi:hypothetical protein
MRATIHLVRLIILDWFDGPLDALGLSSTGESYRVRHVGDPPITESSVFQVRRLGSEAFGLVLNAATDMFGPPASPEWVVPATADRTRLDSMDALLNEHLIPTDENAGYMRTDTVVCRDNDVVWLHERDATRLEPLEGDALWERVNEAGGLA